MATYDLEEQEQIAELKVWWQKYGQWVIAAAVAFVLAVGGGAWLELVAGEAGTRIGGVVRAGRAGACGQ